MRPIDSSTADAEPLSLAVLWQRLHPSLLARAPATAALQTRRMSAAGLSEESLLPVLNAARSPSRYDRGSPPQASASVGKGSLSTTVRSQSLPDWLRSRQDRVCWPIVSDSAADRSGRVARQADDSLMLSTLRDEVAKERTREDSLHGVWTAHPAS